MTFLNIGLYSLGVGVSFFWCVCLQRTRGGTIKLAPSAELAVLGSAFWFAFVPVFGMMILAESLEGWWKSLERKP